VSENSWDVFAKSLAMELSRLPDGAVVVLEESSNRNHYIQFMQSSDSLYAELAAGSAPANGLSISRSTERSLRTSGWKEPDKNGSIPNWGYELAWPAPWKDYLELAVTTTAFLHDTLGVVAPASLVHRSWNRYTNEQLELASLGVPPASSQEG
jgi:hypothetical protein